jgi:hypothetical protein
MLQARSTRALRVGPLQLCAFLLLLSIVLFASQAALGSEWYRGGTLHKATGGQWQAAPYSNRLATSADFVAAATQPRSMSELRTKATSMERCVTEASRGPESRELQVSGLAAACVVLLGW